MLTVTAIIVAASLLPAYVVGQITIGARCLSGYEWTYNYAGQSPCYVAGTLAAVCVPGTEVDVPPLPTGYHYAGPTVNNANACRCSSVVYSLTSACGYCQGRSYLSWSEYAYNCSTVYNRVYNYDIPSGVRVPAWAYLDVQTGDGFNATQAQLTTGTESTGSGPAPTVVA